MTKQIFLGGASGKTTWRTEIAIPILETAGVTYFNPQLGVGEWTKECEAAEMKAKAEAEVLLFVVSGETRGVAGIAEAAYYIGARRPLALVVNDVSEGTVIENQIITGSERDDLNRGRIFIRSMAKSHDVPVFEDVESATDYAVKLVRKSVSLGIVQDILRNVKFKDFKFLVEPVNDGFHLQIFCPVTDVDSGTQSIQEGRKWFINPFATESEIVQTAFKAVVTWEEHEAREHFRYRDAGVFNPHLDVLKLVELWRTGRDKPTED